MMYLLRLPWVHFARSHFFQIYNAIPRSSAFAALCIAISLTFVIAEIVDRIPARTANTAAAAASLPEHAEQAAKPISADTISAVGGAKVARADTPVTTKNPTQPMREIHIANNGAVFLRGARISAINGPSIEVRAGWGSMEFTWDVRTRIGTRYINSKGEIIKSSALKVGDIVAVTGVLDESAGEASMRAQYIRVSIPKGAK